MNELAIANPVALSDLNPPFGQIVRQFPDAQCPFLRFQVGVNVTRPMIEARFEGNKFIGESPNGKRVTVFKVLGFGETFEAAQRMAGGAR